MSNIGEKKKTSWDTELQAKFISGFGSPSNFQLSVAEWLFNFLATRDVSVSETVIMSSVTSRKTTKVSVLRSLVEFSIVFRSSTGGNGKQIQYHIDKDVINAGQKLVLQTSQDETTANHLPPSEKHEGRSVSPLAAEPQLQAKECRIIYKRLKLPDGEIIEVTKEEFDRIVEFYRNLHAQALTQPNLLSKEKKK